MSYDEIDYMHDAAMQAMYDQFSEDPAVKEQFYRDLYDEIVTDFTDARLRSYYEEQPEVAVLAETALADATVFLPQHDTAAFIFGAIAAEVALTSTLLKPIVHGLVHTASAAALITRLAIRHNDENLTKILLDLLATYGRVDPREFKRAGSAKSLWEELKDVRVKRNGVVHRAERTSHDEATLAVNVATVLLRELFPAVVTNLGLHLHGLRVCNALHR